MSNAIPVCSNESTHTLRVGENRSETQHAFHSIAVRRNPFRIEISHRYADCWSQVPEFYILWDLNYSKKNVSAADGSFGKRGTMTMKPLSKTKSMAEAIIISLTDANNSLIAVGPKIVIIMLSMHVRKKICCGDRHILKPTFQNGTPKAILRLMFNRIWIDHWLSGFLLRRSLAFVRACDCYP